MSGKQYPTFEEYLEHEYDGPYMATDIIIEYQNGIVLIERKFKPYGLALPGGIAERLNFTDNAVKEAKEETGLDVIINGPQYRPFYLDATVSADPRAHIATAAYIGRGSGTLAPHQDEDAKRAFVVQPAELYELLKDKKAWAFKRHREILETYMDEVLDWHRGWRDARG